MNWTWYAILLAAMVVGLFINLLGLPGLWIMVASALVYAWATDWIYLGWQGLTALTGLALLAEAIEFVAGSAGAKAAGGSKRGMLGAMIGGLVGALVGSGMLPIIGTIAGAVAGSLVGAGIVEFALRCDYSHSWRVGVGAAKGRFWGLLSKSAVGMIMFIVAAVTAWPR